MTLDPNWFYSSLAQCAAAIVGIVGSVLAVRLQYQLDEAKRNAATIIDDFLTCRDKARAIRSDAARIAGLVNRDLPGLEQVLEQGGQQIAVTEFATFTSTVGHMTIGVTPEVIAEWRNRRTSADRIASTISAMMKLKELKTIEQTHRDLVRINESVIEEAQRRTGPVVELLRRLSHAVARHQDQTSIWLAVVLTVVLALLCILGLLVPLTYLSAYEGLHKAWLTAAFAVGVMALPFVIAIQVYEIRKSGRLVLAPEDVLADP